jgi:hypothetical protein
MRSRKGEDENGSMLHGHLTRLRSIFKNVDDQRFAVWSCHMENGNTIT